MTVTLPGHQCTTSELRPWDHPVPLFAVVLSDSAERSSRAGVSAGCAHSLALALALRGAGRGRRLPGHPAAPPARVPSRAGGSRRRDVRAMARGAGRAWAAAAVLCTLLVLVHSVREPMACNIQCCTFSPSCLGATHMNCHCPDTNSVGAALVVGGTGRLQGSWAREEAE